MAFRDGDEADPSKIIIEEAEEAPILDNPDVPIIYVDGVADIEIHDPNVRITYYEKIDDECGGECRVKALVVIRPLSGCHDGVALFQRRVSQKSRRRHH